MDTRRNRRDKVVAMKIYVEGGGRTTLLRTSCRQGFSEFLKKAGCAGRMPRIVACGSREDAFGAFSTAMKKGESAMLLVDSESPVADDCRQGEMDNWRPWRHLGERLGDHWEKPTEATESDCHLMVQCMEAWFLADRNTLHDFFGHGFHEQSLPGAEKTVESISKQEIFPALARATKNCKTKAPYGKGEHSFKLLARVSPELVAAASPWASRFMHIAKIRLGC